MRMTTRVSTLAVLASALFVAGATAQPSDKQSRIQGGRPDGQRPAVVPKGQAGSPRGIDKRVVLQQGRAGGGPVPAQVIPRGPQEKINFAPGGDRPQIKPRNPQNGPPSLQADRVDPSRAIKARGQVPGGVQAPALNPKAQQAGQPGGRIEIRPSRPNNQQDQIRNRRPSEGVRSVQGIGAPQIVPKDRNDRGPGGKVTVQPRGGQGQVPVQPRGAAVKPGVAGGPAVRPKQADRSPGATATVVPKGQALPAGVTGKAVPSGSSKTAVTARGVSAGKTATVVPKGVDRDVLGNLPPGLVKGKLAPAASAVPGLSGKPVVLPKQVSSSALSGFQSLRRDLNSRRPLPLRKLGSREKSVAIGANFLLGGTAIGLGYSKLLSKDDALTFFGGVAKPAVHPRSLTKHDIVALRHGYLPDFVPPPVPGFGYVRPPVIPAAIYTAPGYLPPAVHAHVDVAPSFSWNYWDGRSYYDHDYATSLFVSIGHTRYDGFDGAIVGGRYYAFGYGWIDGCINYGQGRVWVPGFWAPQTVTECRPVPVWVPPVYEQVWTGCCWETIQVGGGYFAPAPAEECHTVTRYVWVPGHYEYYYV